MFEIYQGGLDHDSVVFRFFSSSPGQGFSFFIEIYQNGEEETTLSPTTVTELTSKSELSTTTKIDTTTETQSSIQTTTEPLTTTELPEKKVREWGIINDDSVLLAE